MALSPRQRAMLPLIALQGSVGTLIGFIGYFVMAVHDVHAMFSFTAIMLTSAMGATALAYFFGPRLQLSAARILKLGFLVPGLLLLFGDHSPWSLALAYGSFLGFSWGARHWLEMSMLKDGERDSYAARAGTASVVFSVGTTLLVTTLLAALTERSDYVYWLYGTVCVIGAFVFGNRLPHTPLAPLQKPLRVLRQPQFIASLPLFFLESGLFGISQALASAGASEALGSASRFGGVVTLAGLAGGFALYLTRRNRHVSNRANWLGASCLVVGTAFVLLGASIWIPALYVVYSVLKAIGSPFLLASEQVLNQQTLDIDGALSDRIFARELVLWILRMLSLGMFWVLADTLAPRQVLVAGSLVLAIATGLEYMIGRARFAAVSTRQPA